jgi:hypothetical protein
MHKGAPMSIFLKAKHWQLFLILLGIMFSAQAPIFNSVSSQSSPNVMAFLLPTLTFALLYFGWLCSVALACSKALPSELYSSPKPMFAGLIYALLYLIFSSQFFASPNEQPPGYIFPMHLAAMVAIFYSLGFTAKQLVKLERQQKVSFFSYSGPFFLFWFFPIGVWFIQPKVNQFLGNNA